MSNNNNNLLVLLITICVTHCYFYNLIIGIHRFVVNKYNNTSHFNPLLYTRV